MLDQAAMALLLTLLAGLSTLLGTFIILFVKDKNEKIITFSLAFAAGVMISISFTDLWPQAQEAMIQHLGRGWGIITSSPFWSWVFSLLPP